MSTASSPLRRRVQKVVDHRFNRARHDADQTVAAFAARLKEALDLGSVRDDLAGVVHQALEPTHVSVLIRTLDGTNDRLPQARQHPVNVPCQQRSLGSERGLATPSPDGRGEITLSPSIKIMPVKS